MSAGVETPGLCARHLQRLGTAPAPYSTRNRSGVEEMVCSEGRTVNWGDPPAPVGEIDSPGSLPWYKATPKSRAVRRESERVVLLMTVETTQLDAREGPVLW